jgi:hypothetical protein
MVDADEAAGAGHVVDDEYRIAGNVLAHVAAHDSRINVVAAAGCERHDDAHGLALIKRRLGRRLFKVQRVQGFNAQKKNGENNPIEPLNP